MFKKDIEKRHFILRIQLKLFSRRIIKYYDAIIFGFPTRFGNMTPACRISTMFVMFHHGRMIVILGVPYSVPELTQSG
jgi:hypothetical protein